MPRYKRKKKLQYRQFFLNRYEVEYGVEYKYISIPKGKQIPYLEWANFIFNNFSRNVFLLNSYCNFAVK